MNGTSLKEIRKILIIREEEASKLGYLKLNPIDPKLLENKEVESLLKSYNFLLSTILIIKKKVNQ